MDAKTELIEAALGCGAKKAAVIGQDSVVLSEEFRAICEKNQCGRYGACWQCPPDCGGIDLLMEKVRSFPFMLIYQSVTTIEDSFDIEGMQAAGEAHSLLCQRVRKAACEILKHPFFCLGSGGCHLCDQCTRSEGDPCRHPNEAMISMESCGIDVYNTVKGTDLKYINGTNTVTYFGAVLFSE